MEIMVAVAPDLFSRGLDINNPDPLRHYHQVGLDEVLSTTYWTDAHFVPYVALGADDRPTRIQPRINADGLGMISSVGISRLVATCLVAYIPKWAVGAALGATGEFAMPQPDCWTTPEAARLAVALVHQEAPYAAIYATSRGLRLIQPLRTPIDVRDYANRWQRWARRLSDLGLVADVMSMHWTRHFRAPYVHTVGAAHFSPHVFNRWTPVETYT